MNDHTLLMNALLPRHTITLPDRVPKQFFRVHQFESTNRPAQSDAPHRHDFYQLLYIGGGEGLQIIDCQPYPVVTAALYFLTPAHVHFWRLQTPLVGYGVLFTPDWLLSDTFSPPGFDLLSFIHTRENAPEVRIPVELRPEVEQIFQTLYTESCNAEFGYNAILAAYLYILLAKVQRFCVSQQSVSSPTNAPADLERRFKHLVAEHHRTQHSVQFYADRIGVTADYLSEVIKASTGYTASQLIRNALILEAKRLLVNTSHSIQQISHLLSFEEQTYFARFFRREVGLSPREFRQTFWEKYQISPV
jgi:AraC-like DNA-binding protein